MDAKEALITSVSSKATQAGAWSAVGAWFAGQDTLGLIGLAVGITGLLVNWYYRAKENRLKVEENRRAQELHIKRMEGFND